MKQILLILMAVVLAVALFIGTASATEKNINFEGLKKVERHLKSIAISLKELTFLYKQSIEDAELREIEKLIDEESKQWTEKQNKRVGRYTPIKQLFIKQE